MVTALRLRNTKKGDRYASFQLEDKTGFIEVIVWPDIYRKCMDTLVLDDPILVQGRMEVGEERVQIIAKGVIPLAQASQKVGRGHLSRTDQTSRHLITISGPFYGLSPPLYPQSRRNHHRTARPTQGCFYPGTVRGSGAALR